MAIHRLYTITGQLAASILAYADLAREIRDGSGDLPMQILPRLASYAGSSKVNATRFAADAARSPVAADKALQDSGGGTLADYPANFQAIDTAAGALNVALRAVMLDPEHVEVFAYAPRPHPSGTAQYGPADAIPAALAQTIRDLPELAALIGALEDAGATATP